MQSHKKINVLITGVGGNRAIFIWKALKKSNLPIRIVGCDCSHLAAGLYRADIGYLMPPASADDYLDTLQEVIRAEQVDIVLIGTNEELDVLSEKASLVTESTGAYVVVPPKHVFDIAKDKWALAAFLQENNFAYPESVLPENKDSLRRFIEKVPFPYIVKERLYSGSRGLHVVHDKESLETSIAGLDCPIIQEYLFPDDEEYTVGCFCDRNSKAIGSIVMRRQLAFGVTSKAQVVKNQGISDYCEAVAEKIGFVGPLNLQLRLTKSGPVIFEINPRFSSTESARAFYNYNTPEMCIRNFVLGEDLSPPVTTDGYFFRHLEDVFIDTEHIEKMSGSGINKAKTGTVVSNF